MKQAEDLEQRDVLLFDTNSAERERLQTILTNAGYKVVCVADEGALLEAAQRINPTCIILDVTVRGVAGLSVLQDLIDYGTPVIVTSENGDIPTAVEAIKAGAQNFIHKPFVAEKIVEELEEIRSGSAGPLSKALRTKASPFHFPGPSLTRRERDVVAKLAFGLSSRETALALGISHRTVEDHRGKIMRKLGVRNAAELMIAILKPASKPLRLRDCFSSPAKGAIVEGRMPSTNMNVERLHQQRKDNP